ncbi:two-component system, OmpR family, sensor histidine kinase TctE [Arboricoccus pini]|uniref:histidine kinase n=1 Tax=Arboricoccus pini TaxID=1963835 RepID=A0A212RPF8_9PROT|nr:sensor histidine kinase [Arboricoccus pini]SNB74273.1 two-component system, OmpR family, sensor histidine kinase TctE [Arboricoccus pini]
MNRLSLRVRLIGLIALVFLLGSTVLTVAAWAYARIAADRAYDRLLIGAALQIAGTVSVEEGQAVVDPPISAFAMLGLAEGDSIFYKVEAEGSRLLTGYADLDVPGGPVTAEPVLADGAYRGRAIRLVTLGRYLTDTSSPGWAKVTVAQTRSARSNLAFSLTMQALKMLVVLGFLILVAVLLAVHLAFLPLSHLGHVIRARDPNDLRPLNVPVPSEVQGLVNAVDRFMALLAARIQFMQRFIADAAHQIRTPLTALNSQLDLLRSEPLPAAQARHLERIQIRADELSRLANQLLDHAMVVHRGTLIAPEPVDLVHLARRRLGEIALLPLDRPVNLSLDIEGEPALVMGDRVLLGEALSNVLHNALLHGARSELRVTVGTRGGQARITVSDDGPGIPEPLWSAVREPFHARQDGRPGAGLGLSIVVDALRAHGGELLFQHEPGRAFTVILSLPARLP